MVRHSVITKNVGNENNIYRSLSRYFSFKLVNNRAIFKELDCRKMKIQLTDQLICGRYVYDMLIEPWDPASSETMFLRTCDRYRKANLLLESSFLIVEPEGTDSLSGINALQ